MVNSLRLIGSTAAFLVRLPHSPSTSTSRSNTKFILSRDSREDVAFVRLQNKMGDKAEEIMEKLQQPQGEGEVSLDERSSNDESELWENPLLEMLPAGLPGGNDDDEEEKREAPSMSTEHSLLFDIQDQWKDAENDFSDFLSRILGGNSSEGDDESHSSGESDIEISEKTAASSSTDKDTLEEYGDKASKRHPDVEVEENSRNTPSFGVTSKMFEPIEALLTNNDGDNTGGDNNGGDNNGGDNKDEQKSYSDSENDVNEGLGNTLKSRAQSWMEYLSLPGGGTEQSIEDMIATARESAQHDGSAAADEKSFQEVLGILRQYSAEVKGTVDKYFGDIDLSSLRPTSLFYYLEKEDEHKNPSWKRRIHRFYPGVGVERMNQLNDALALSKVAYMDSVEEAKQRLESLTDPYELLYCNLVAEPNQPAHYVAVKQNQNQFSPALELVLGVRGTKTITDAITDVLCEDQDYRGGKAHSGVLESGKYIAEKHTPLIQELLESSGKQSIKIKLVGHSLGAGAAAIAAMEFKDHPKMDVEVVGFGPPAMLSQKLSEGMKGYMTTVVADDDVVPRLSAATVINVLLDVMEYDYVPR